MIKTGIPSVLPVARTASGNRAMMLPKIKSDMPLPMPRWVISSPSHMISAVPATNVRTMSTSSPNVNFTFAPRLISSRWKKAVKPIDSISPNAKVKYRVHCVILRWPVSPSFAHAPRVGITMVKSCKIIEAVIYGIIPNANTAKLDNAPPANRSTKPRIGVCSKRVLSAFTSTPGTGTWAPNRYTAIIASVNSMRRFRSGTLNAFAIASII